MEIAAASEKLAECQETIFLLGKQLNALHPPSESLGSSPNLRQQLTKDASDDKPTMSGFSNNHASHSPQYLEHAELENSNTSTTLRAGAGSSPPNGYNFPVQALSDTESGPSIPKSPLDSKLQKHRSSKSSSSYSSSNSAQEKHGRGLTRFFSKGKIEHWKCTWGIFLKCIKPDRACISQISNSLVVEGRIFDCLRSDNDLRYCS